MADFNYTEFCCRNGGSNLNAGTLLGDSTEPGTSPSFEFIGGTWVQATRVFTLASGTTTGLAVGMYCSVYTAGATATGYISRITGLTSSTITLSAIENGTNPANGTYTMRVGGAWKGVKDDGTNFFTENFPGVTAGVASGHTGVARCNYKNDQTYSVTAVTTVGGSDTRVHQGYASTYGDGGKAVFDGGVAGVSFNLWNVGAGAEPIAFADIIFQNNGASGAAAGVVTGCNNAFFWRCVVRNVRGPGFNNTVGAAYSECEAYACNQSNTTNTGGFQNTGTAAYHRCISHHHPDSNSRGFYLNGSAALKGCIAYKNGNAGYRGGASMVFMMTGCDAYDNGSHGTTGMQGCIENCNFLKNVGYGIDPSSIAQGLLVLNCGFGSGSMQNSSGQINKTGMGAVVIETGTITYTTGTTPWADPDDGDFDVTSSQAKGQGRGRFLQTAPGQSGTDSTPDVGAGQGNSADASGGGSGRRLALTIGLGL